MNPKDPPALIQALLDGGANCNLISNSRAKSLAIVPHVEEGSIKFGNTSSCSITHSLFLELTANYNDIQFTFHAKFFICNCPEDIIIGRPTLNSTGLIHLYVTVGDVAPNPFEVHNIDIEIMDDQSGELDDSEIIPDEPAFCADTEDLWIHFCSLLGTEPDVFFDVLDWSARNTEISVNEILQDFSKILSQMPPHYKRNRRADLVIERKSHLNAPWKSLNKAIFILQNALNSVWDVENRGIAKFRPMHIPFDWDKYKPVRVNAQNLNQPMSEALKHLLDGFESKKLVVDVPREILDSLTTISPLMVYPKKDPTKYRLLWDGKRSGVNQASRPISGAAPVADEHINRLCNHDIVNVADGDNFYWQLALAKESQPLTAFVTKLGIKMFAVCPQGHTNVCAHVSNVVGDAFIKEDIQDVLGSYFDDHHGAADFGETELTKFHSELILLIKFHVYAIRYNVVFSPPKALLGHSSVEFLGFTCSKAGKAISLTRIKCLMEIKVPTNRDELQQLLGCFVFVAKWMKNFSALAAPLYDLLKKGCRFIKEWNQKHVLALDAMKECAKNAPILKIIDYMKTLFFESDASPLLSISAVLYQIVDGKELPVCYGSKKLTPAQKKWPAVQVEFYSIVNFSRAWRMIMIGAKIHMRIDARNLLWAEKSQNAWIQNWYHEISNFLQVVEVTHVEGKNHQPCDGLSRVVNVAVVDLQEEFLATCLESSEVCPNTFELSVNEIDLEELAAQESDPTCNEMLPEFTDVAGPAMTKLRYYIISLCHNHIVGHAGVAGTCSLLRRANLHKCKCFSTFTEMTELVSIYVKGCATCQLTWSLLSSRYPMSEMVLHEYFEIIDCDWVHLGIDLLGNKEALVVRDRLTRYVEVFPSNTATGEEFAKYLLIISGRYGAPAEVCTDGPTVFTAHFIDCFLSLLGTKRKKILTYRPKAMPAERSVKDVIRHLRALIVERPEVLKKWSSHLPIAVSVINDTFCVATHTTPNKMMYGDKVNRIRGILTDHGESSIRVVGPNFASEVSIAHALIMSAAEDFFQERLKKALDHMPDFDSDMVYRPGEYVVAIVPPNQKGKRPKLLPKVRGLYIVLKTDGNNSSSVTCRNVHDDTIEIIHAQDLLPIDLKAIDTADEILTLAAGLKAIPEYVVVRISDHRFTATSMRPNSLRNVDLESLSFLCHYSGLPEEESTWWCQYKDVKHLALMRPYLDLADSIIPETIANGNSFEDSTIAQLKSFARFYHIPILDRDSKAIIIGKIQSARAESNNR